MTSRRVLIGAGGAIAAASVIVLAVYLAVNGFRSADTVGVIGAVVGIAGLVLALYGMTRRARTPEPQTRDRSRPRRRPENLQMRATASGSSRIYQSGGDMHIDDSNQ